MTGNYQIRQDHQDSGLLHKAYQTTLRVLSTVLGIGLTAGPAGAATIPAGFGQEGEPMEYTAESGALTGNYGDMRACIDEADVMGSSTDTRTIDSIMVQGGEGATQITKNMTPVEAADDEFAHPAYCFDLTKEILQAGLTGDGNKGELLIHINQGDADTYEKHTVHYTLETDDADFTVPGPTGFGATLSGVTYDATNETYTFTLTTEAGREGDGYTLSLSAFDREMGAVTISTPGTELSSQGIEHGTSTIDASAYDLSDYKTVRFKVCSDTTADCEMEKVETPNGGHVFAADEGLSGTWYDESETDDGDATTDFDDPDVGEERVTTLGHGATGDGDSSLEATVATEITAVEWQSRMAQAIGEVGELTIRTRYKGTTGRVGRTEAASESDRKLAIYSGTNLDAKKYVAQLNHYAKVTWGAPLIDNNTTVSMTFDALETDSVQTTERGEVTTMNTGTHTGSPTDNIHEDKGYLHRKGGSPVARIMFNESLDVGAYNEHTTPTGRTATTGNTDAAVQDYSLGLGFTTTISGEEVSVLTQNMDIGVYPVEGHTPEQVVLTALAIGGGVGTALGITAAIVETDKRKAEEARADELQDLLDNMPEGEGGNVYTPSHDTAPDEHTE